MIAEAIERDGSWSWDSPNLRRLIDLLLPYELLRGEIIDLWLPHSHHRDEGWTVHHDINDVMLATAMIPTMFLFVANGIRTDTTP